jgi:hypothetical protein
MDVGLILSTEALDWQQALAAEVAARLAVGGFVVARCSAQTSESEAGAATRFEKVLDACATSPYARNVKRWVLAGEQIAFAQYEPDTALPARSSLHCELTG